MSKVDKKDPMWVEQEKIVVNKPTAQDCDVNNCQTAETSTSELDSKDVDQVKQDFLDELKNLRNSRDQLSSDGLTIRNAIEKQIEQIDIAMNELIQIRDEHLKFGEKLEFSPAGNAMWIQEGFNQFVTEPKFNADEKLIEHVVKRIFVTMENIKEVRNTVKQDYDNIFSHEDQVGYKEFVLFMENRVDFNAEGQLVEVEMNTGANPSST